MHPLGAHWRALPLRNDATRPARLPAFALWQHCPGSGARGSASRGNSRLRAAASNDCFEWARASWLAQGLSADAHPGRHPVGNCSRLLDLHQAHHTRPPRPGAKWLQQAVVRLSSPHFRAVRSMTADMPACERPRISRSLPRRFARPGNRGMPLRASPACSGSRPASARRCRIPAASAYSPEGRASPPALEGAAHSGLFLARSSGVLNCVKISTTTSNAASG